MCRTELRTATSRSGRSSEHPASQRSLRWGGTSPPSGIQRGQDAGGERPAVPASHQRPEQLQVAARWRRQCRSSWASLRNQPFDGSARHDQELLARGVSGQQHATVRWDMERAAERVAEQQPTPAIHPELTARVNSQNSPVAVDVDDGQTGGRVEGQRSKDCYVLQPVAAVEAGEAVQPDWLSLGLYEPDPAHESRPCRSRGRLRAVERSDALVCLDSDESVVRCHAYDGACEGRRGNRRGRVVGGVRFSPSAAGNCPFGGVGGGT